jgi:hypothetical protein
MPATATSNASWLIAGRARRRTRMDRYTPDRAQSGDPSPGFGIWACGKAHSTFRPDVTV